MIFAIILFLFSNLNGMQSAFNDGQKSASQLNKNIEGNIKSGKGKREIPQYSDGIKISQDELAKSFENAAADGNASIILETQRTRAPYIVDSKEDFMLRSEDAHKNPKKNFKGTEAIDAGRDGYSVEYCEECPQEEFFVKARKTKKRAVYLQAPPYVEASQRCENHGLLSVRVQVLQECDELFREDGQFLNIQHINTVQHGGAYIDETYNVNGATLVLRKTIMQEGQPWIRPDCYLVPALQNNVISAATLITKLLGGTEDERLNWGEIQNAYLHHRVVNDTGEHYWILDDACQHYEKLSDQGLCRYVSVEEDPPMHKYWKGKKVYGSWGQTVTYACRAACKDTCGKLRARGCSRQGNPTCLEKVGNKCVRYRWTFRCHDKVGMKKTTFSKENPFCLGGDCIDSSFESDRDMIEALGYMAILEEARKEFDGTKNIAIFKGQSYACSKFPIAFKDCCGSRGGWGVSLGFSDCGEEANVLCRLRSEKKCIQVGQYCAERFPFTGVCLRQKTVFCCFGSKFGKLLQEQGRKQLGMTFGTPECPECRGFTPEELSRLDFSKLDLTEIAEEVMDKFKPQKGEHFAKAGELEKIRKQMQDKGIGNATQQMQENIKHMGDSFK